MSVRIPEVEELERVVGDTGHTKGVDAPAIRHGAEARVVIQVSDDQAPIGDVGRHLRQDRGDVFVRQAVEAESPQAGFAMFAGQRRRPGYGMPAKVKARVEARDLRHAREQHGHGFERRETVRVMNSRKALQHSQLVQHETSDENRSGEARPDMRHTMTDAQHTLPSVRGPNPLRDGLYGRMAITDRLDPAARVKLPGSNIRPPVHAESQPGGAGVHHERIVVHWGTPISGRHIFRRRLTCS